MTRLPSSIVGFGLGVVVVMAIGAVYFTARTMAFSAARGTPLATLTSAPTPSETEPPATPAKDTPGPPTSTPIPPGLATAEAHLAAGDGASALNALVPLLDQLTLPEDLARLNSDLAMAELQMGHFQRAAGYYEAAFALEPSPELLLELASAYDLGGDLHSALARYLRLASWDEADEILRQIARDRARDIVSVLGTPTPGS